MQSPTVTCGWSESVGHILLICYIIIHERNLWIVSNGNLRSSIILFNTELFVHNVLGNGPVCQPLLEECCLIVINSCLCDRLSRS